MGASPPAGDAASDSRWTQRDQPRAWSWLASSATGEVLVATDSPGRVRTSVDGGATWTTGNSPTAAWTSADMSADAGRIVAAASGGGLFMSTDRGATWSAVAAPAGEDFGNRPWTSVTVSDDGRRIAAAVLDGPVYVSQDGGATWTLGLRPCSTPTSCRINGDLVTMTASWGALGSSADGRHMVAVPSGTSGMYYGPTYAVYVSADGGLTWNARQTPGGGSHEWHRVAVSGDGQTIAIAGRTQSPLLVSRDGGGTWGGYATSRVGNYSAIAMSSDGRVIGTTINGGDVLLSQDAGATFAPLALPGTDTNWRAMALSADGQSIAVAAGSPGGASGALYTSTGHRTSASR
ncbi:WD40/YVTN/BNR-like repeat-containing protein [Ramlibacter tataouinensis]|uniref:WD40/YVTN/BNR-like repeat-containing protein n=1 Tax=Ramlibacter tataouinensis TaxID=94132 RepID=UPI00130518F9|nr:sialidase family protein [Ramlibacter tataouinensis]